MKSFKEIATICVLLLVAIFLLAIPLALIGSQEEQDFHPQEPVIEKPLAKFASCEAMTTAFKNSSTYYSNYRKGWDIVGIPSVSMPMAAGATNEAAQAPDYSTTNIQVEGVDEADIVKTDGTYIYAFASSGNSNTNNDYIDEYYPSDFYNSVVIAKAYPASNAEILSRIQLNNTQPSEMFIDRDTLLIFGYNMLTAQTTTVVEIYDVKDRENPEHVRTLSFVGDYLSSRKIGSEVYFVIKQYPNIPYFINDERWNNLKGEDIAPTYTDSLNPANDVIKTKCGDIGYFDINNLQNFVTIASVDMADPTAEISKEVIAGQGDNIYASQENLYLAENDYYYAYENEQTNCIVGIGCVDINDNYERTNIHKFHLSDGTIAHVADGSVPGTILNQFSMDEYDSHFRIATTKGEVWSGNSENNIYVLDATLNLTGKIEDIAHGEKIYSARFMSGKGYLVTFKKVDPFFVIDLSDHANPKILGKLKIPGYSDYLHPYDENHIIGIGKEAVEAEGGNFAWYQGMKMAIFDVTDVAHPIEMHKVEIGDRGTTSDALSDHKAFLFDKEKNLLALPILLAEIPDKENAESNSYGDFVYQGLYVYKVTLDNGFELKGRITHNKDNDTFVRSGWYYNDDKYSIKRSLYIDNALYTLSNKMLKANALDTLAEIKELDL